MHEGGQETLIEQCRGGELGIKNTTVVVKNPHGGVRGGLYTAWEAVWVAGGVLAWQVDG